MPNVPKIVRDRLNAASPVDHPDANLLTAFAENFLPGRERAAVLDHLSHCTDCREVIALALPATEPVQATLTPKRTSWLSWPALRWGLVAAGVVAIASFGVVRYQHESRLATTTLRTASPAEPATEAKNEAPRPEMSVNPDKFTDRAALPAPAAASRERKQEHLMQPAPRRTTAGIPTIGGPLVARQQQAFPQVQQPAPASPLFARQQPAASTDLRVPSANETVEVSSANAQVETAQNQPGAAQSYAYDEPALRKAKPAETPQAASAGAVIAAQVNPGAPMQLAAMPPAARWTISSTGALQRSFDQGRTWEDVNVIASAAPSAQLIAREARADASSAVQASKKSMKQNALNPLTFRVVTANGPDVWAGASQGMLYHSANNGNQWIRVVPSTAGAILTGDIVALDFPDPQHGTITTSTPEVWATSDAGQTWQKQ